jgi:hypothetical protein
MVGLLALTGLLQIGKLIRLTEWHLLKVDGEHLRTVI